LILLHQVAEPDDDPVEDRIEVKEGYEGSGGLLQKNVRSRRDTAEELPGRHPSQGADPGDD
jgi:hypothetical protein